LSCVSRQEGGRDSYQERVKHSMGLLATAKELASSVSFDAAEFHTITYLWEYILSETSDAVRLAEDPQPQCRANVYSLCDLLSESISSFPMPHTQNSDFLCPLAWIQLTVMLRELKLAFDIWHVLNETHALDIQVSTKIICLSGCIRTRLIQLHGALSREHRILPSFYNREFQLLPDSERYQYELILYNSFLLENVIFVEPVTNPGTDESLFPFAREIALCSGEALVSHDMANPSQNKPCTADIGFWALYLCSLLLNWSIPPGLFPFLLGDSRVVDLATRQTVASEVRAVANESAWMSEIGVQRLIRFHDQARLSSGISDTGVSMDNIGLVDCMHYFYWCYSSLGRHYDISKVEKFWW
jgi:hypothetical protein